MNNNALPVNNNLEIKPKSSIWRIFSITLLTFGVLIFITILISALIEGDSEGGAFFVILGTPFYFIIGLLPLVIAALITQLLKRNFIFPVFVLVLELLMSVLMNKKFLFNRDTFLLVGTAFVASVISFYILNYFNKRKKSGKQT